MGASVYIPDELQEQLQEVADQCGLSIHDFVVRALDSAIQQERARARGPQLTVPLVPPCDNAPGRQNARESVYPR